MDCILIVDLFEVECALYGPVFDHSSFEELLNEVEDIRCRCFRPTVVSFRKENKCVKQESAGCAV